MPRSRRIRLTALALSLVGACVPDAPPPEGRALAAGASQDTLAPFMGTMGPVRQPRRGPPGAPAALHLAARAAREPGFDRLVFEFSSDSVPGYQVAYATEPIRHCGSGDLVLLEGTGFLVVRFEPAQAHDDQGRPTITDREWSPQLPAVKQVKQMKLVCDFEGQVEWAVGLAASRRYRVLEAAAPARVIVDVRHRD